MNQYNPYETNSYGGSYSQYGDQYGCQPYGTPMRSPVPGTQHANAYSEGYNMGKAAAGGLAVLALLFLGSTLLGKRR